MPNILMVSVDDLNSWTSVLGGYPGAVHTPNLDRIAAQSVTFANAFCTAPDCNMSRASALSGMSPERSGVITHDQDMFEFVDPAMTLPGVLNAHGWTTATAGKVFHHLPDTVAPQIYDHVLAPRENPGMQDKNPAFQQPTMQTLPAGYFTGDPESLNDAMTVKAVTDFLASYGPDAGDAGLFLSVGLTRPHQPWFVPKEYFDLYPLDEIVLPETMPDDLSDIPLYGRSFANPSIVAATVAAGEYKLFVQAYLAAISYMDAMLGRLLDALNASAIADDTVIVFWSDHGYHLGEKERFHKGTLWDEATRSELMIYDPSAHATDGQVRQEVVSLLDIFPTLMDYAGIERLPWLEGDSLIDVVQQGDATGLRGYAVTSLSGSQSIRTAEYRYTRYEDGSEELYHLPTDPHSYTNLAGDAAATGAKVMLSAMLDDHLEAAGVHQNYSTEPLTLDGSDGGRLMIAGPGADTLIGSSEDNVYLIRSPDTIIREAENGGEDWVFARGSYSLPTNIENLVGGKKAYAGPDAPDPRGRLLAGNALDNHISFEVGSGTLRGGGGDDTLTAFSEEDVLVGGTGDDVLDAGNGEDRLRGNLGNDTMVGGLGDDTYYVSPGADRIVEAAASGGGVDRIDISAWGYENTQIDFTYDSRGIAIGLTLTHRQLGWTTAVAPAAKGKLAVELLVDNGEQILLWGGSVSGTARDDTITGSGRGDIIEGLGGDDLLSGGSGADSLLGGHGSDLLIGGRGNDTLDGGDGWDTASYADATAGITVGLGLASPPATGASGIDQLFGIEALIGSAYADRLAGNGHRNRLEGGDGNDSLVGGGHQDTLQGGAGRDVLRGGDGSDQFYFGSLQDSGIALNAADRITDYEGRDIIDLTAIDADETTAADDVFQFIGVRSFTAAGQLRSWHENDMTLVALNVDADPIEEMIIRLDGLVTLHAVNFML